MYILMQVGPFVGNMNREKDYRPLKLSEVNFYRKKNQGKKVIDQQNKLGKGY